MSETPTAENGLRTIPDAEALRDHLDTLNEAGADFRAAGMDARGGPFLIVLHGCYADTEQVFYGSPWDSEVDYGTPQWCDECNAHAPSGIGTLAYPVTVLTRVTPPVDVSRLRDLIAAYGEERHSDECGIGACVRCVVDEFAACVTPPADMCHNGHPFEPGRTVDDLPGESHSDWCNVCGEARPIPPAKPEETS